MCSWCWAYKPTATKLFARLPKGVRRVNILGGLAADDDRPMPEDQQQAIAGHWHRIHDLLGTRFNFSFWEKCAPCRSTYPACRAVIAAARQGREEAMIEAIQRAFYLHAIDPSEPAELLMLAERIGLDSQQFAADVASSAANHELHRQVRFARQSPIRGFPSLAIEVDGRLHPLNLDYRHHEPTVKQIEELCSIRR